MHTKHTFAFTLLLGLAWAGLLFAYQNGPDPAANGIFGQPACNQAGCHVGNPLNSAGGTLTLSGLPERWTPGQTYPLTVTVQRAGAVKYGFELSAVANALDIQAGSFSPGNNRVQIICGVGTVGIPVICGSPGAIQYAQHNAVATSVPPFTNVFPVNWTAPDDVNVGAVRFNLAGNAANGNSQNTGDFIYTRADLVDPEAVAPPPPDQTFRSYTLNNLGGASLITDGGGGISVAYSRILADAGNTTPAGVSVFGFRTGGVLVSEAGVPASPLITSGRIYAEVDAPVNTGVAIVNPNPTAAAVTFHYTNAAGVDSGTGVFQLNPGAHLAKFLNEPPFNDSGLVAPALGTFSFSSSVPVSVIALRGLSNERGEFLITTLPVVDLSAPVETSTTVLPHFADGGGWKTQVTLVNPTDATLTGSIQFFSPGSAGVPGAPVTLTANGSMASSFPYSIPRQSSFKLATAGAAATTAAGSVRVTPASGAAPSSLVVFSYKPGPFTVSEAGIVGVRANASRMYVEVTSATSGDGLIQTGMAIANLSAAATTITLELNTLDGAAVGSTTVDLPGSGQIARFVVPELLSVPLPFKGVLRISGGDAAGFSVASLRGRSNERGDFMITTTPATNEAAPTSGAELLFPHLVNGGGYTTQFVLFSGAAGQSASGNLRFFDENGAPLNLNLN